MTPGQGEYAQADLRLADQALRGGRMLMEAGALEDAASRLYYAVFHAARAALTVRGLYSRTHTGQIRLFTETFGPAPVLGRLFDRRAEADYSMEPFTPTSADLQGDAEDAAQFVERCREIVEQAMAAGPDEPDPDPDY